MASCRRRRLHCVCRHFVPNLTIGEPVIKSLRKHTSAFLDCHLMVTNPRDYVEPLVAAGASSFTFHLEAVQGAGGASLGNLDDWRELVTAIHTAGMKAAVAIKPGTPVDNVYPLAEAEEPVDMILVMTVEPGFGGQKFMPEMMAKVERLRERYPHLDIEVDGGLGPSTIDAAAAAGANCIVAGSAVFGAPDPPAVIRSLRQCVLDAQARHRTS
eukprot:SM000160S02545  [mRNA]  locus=s160:97957:99518:- [translate_table: standard]